MTETEEFWPDEDFRKERLAYELAKRIELLNDVEDAVNALVGFPERGLSRNESIRQWMIEMAGEDVVTANNLVQAEKQFINYYQPEIDTSGQRSVYWLVFLQAQDPIQYDPDGLLSANEINYYTGSTPYSEYSQ